MNLTFHDVEPTAEERALLGPPAGAWSDAGPCFAARAEPVQKAVMDGIPILAAVSAPSSLAVELAAEEGPTFIGFPRGKPMNVHAGERRPNVTPGTGNGSAGAPHPPG